MVKETSAKKGIVYLIQVKNQNIHLLLPDPFKGENLQFVPVESSTDINEQKFDEEIIAFIIGSEIQDPIQSTQRLHALKNTASVVILSKPEKINSLKEAIKFSPFVGTDVFCLDESNKIQLEEKLDEILTSSQQAAKYRDILAVSNPKISFKESLQKPAFNQNFVTRLMDIAPIGIAIVGENGKVIGWNKAAASIFNKDEAQILGESLSRLFGRSEATKLEKNLEENLNKRITSQTDTLSLERNSTDQSRQVLNFTFAPFTYNDSSGKALIIAITDTTENVELLSRLRKEVISRDNFLSMASHELRTPLTAMRFNLELLRTRIKNPDFPGAEDILELNSKSLEQADRINELIEDLFDIAKIHSGKLDFNLEKFDLSAFIENYIMEMEEKFKEIHADLELDIESGVIGVWDKNRIEQAFSNLINNVFKYAPDVPVKITLKTNEKWAFLSVSDQGPGISEEKQEVIFDRFERAGANQTISGLGLGLFITKKIIEGHTGEVEVQSSPGQGSTFTFKLPLDLDPENPPENLGVLW